MQSTKDEQIKFDIKANLKRRMEYVGGSLTITNKNLYFNSHSFNVQGKQLVVPMKEIKSIDPAKILFVFPNGVAIQLNDDTSYKFVIGMPWTNKKQEVIDYIRSLIAHV